MKRFLFLTVLMACCSFLQVSSQGWERQLDVHYNESDIVTVEDGFVGLNLFGNIWKLNTQGQVLWNESLIDPFFPGYYFFYYSLFPTADQGFVATGSRFTALLDEDIVLVKTDSLGNKQWERLYDLDPDISRDRGEEVIQTGDGGYLIVGTNGRDTTIYYTFSDIFLLKTDDQGNEEWLKRYTFEDVSLQFGQQILIHPNGGYLLVGTTQNLTENKILLLRLDENGQEIWRSKVGAIGSSVSAKGRLLADGTCYLISSSGNELWDETFLMTLTKVDAQGSEIWNKTIPLAGNTSGANLGITEDGKIALTGTNFSSSNGSDVLLAKADTSGNLIWSRSYGSPFNDLAINMDVTSDGGVVICGAIGVIQQNSSGDLGISFDGYVLKTDSLGNTFTSIASGNVFEDLDADCADLPEAPLKGWLVQLQGAANYLDLTDSLGNYSLVVDTGTYEIKLAAPSPYWQACEPSDTLSIGFYDTLQHHFPVQATIDCPYLIVDLGTPLLRRCFDNIYTVTYCNQGTALAEEAYVEVTLDPFLNFNSASIPLESQEGDIYTFALGDIFPGDCGTFNIQVAVDCDSTVLGQTHCVEAHIFPDSICLPTPGWSGASVVVDGTCTGDSILFLIKNVGSAPTTGPLNYIVIEDQVILFEGDFDLDPGEQTTISIAANGSTFRLEAEQEPNHPGNDQPSISLEGCGNGFGYSIGFQTLFPENDGDPFVSIDCRQNIGSWDPNDKTGYPIGQGDDHFIEPNTDLEYLIRFQNTGSDTAFNIVVRDQLSEFLDITSVVPGTSSFPYRFDIGDDRILSFYFDNILLPDSTTNEVASHGFVKFRVKQIPDNPIGTFIHNAAAIYFDFNEPVITNTTKHKIGINFTEVISDPNPESAPSLHVYPNPFTESARFEVKGLPADALPLVVLGENPNDLSPEELVAIFQNGFPSNTKLTECRIYDALGRLIRKDVYPRSTFTFYRKNLRSGIYFYEIQVGKQKIGTGKIIIQ